MADADEDEPRACELGELRCLVTGASSGIGRAVCRVLVERGAKVVGVGRNERALGELKEDLIAVASSSKSSSFDYVVADLTADGECRRAVETAVSAYLGGELTTVVNAAGVLRGGAVGSSDAAEDALRNYDFNMSCNTRVPYEITHLAVPHLRKAATNEEENEKKKRKVVNEEGQKQDEEARRQSSSRTCSPSIVNVSSVNGKRSFAGCASYCMSKAALDMLTRCASVDLAQYGIRVNSVNPGVVETNLQKTGGMSEEQYAAFLRRSVETTHPLAKSLGRVGQPREVAELVAFLVSDKARFMTGECIAIDGGRQNLGAR